MFLWPHKNNNRTTKLQTRLTVPQIECLQKGASKRNRINKRFANQDNEYRAITTQRPNYQLIPKSHATIEFFLPYPFYILDIAPSKHPLLIFLPTSISHENFLSCHHSRGHSDKRFCRLALHILGSYWYRGVVIRHANS